MHACTYISYIYIDIGNHIIYRKQDITMTLLSLIKRPNAGATLASATKGIN
jgi:hypothetical protein